jgi:hypothetical protein
LKVDWYLVDKDESVIVFGLSEPDARLSAAAPDMLEALKAIVRHYSDYLDDPLNKEARAAIAKAES